MFWQWSYFLILISIYVYFCSFYVSTMPNKDYGFILPLVDTLVSEWNVTEWTLKTLGMCVCEGEGEGDRENMMPD